MNSRLLAPFFALVLVSCASVAESPSASKNSVGGKEAAATSQPVAGPLKYTLQPEAIDPKWDKFGPYFQRMVDKIQTNWQRLLTTEKIVEPEVRSVTASFLLEADGQVSRILTVESTGSDLWTRAQVTAIMSSIPFEPWTDQMKAVLGYQQKYPSAAGSRSNGMPRTVVGRA